jgi:hypothetical protein
LLDLGPIEASPLPPADPDFGFFPEPIWETYNGVFDLIISITPYTYPAGGTWKQG